MRVLITGITGFAGSHLAEYILQHHPDVEVYGLYRWRSRMDNIRHLLDRIHLVECDLQDAAAVYWTLHQVRPDWIFHLAAQSFVPTSWRLPSETFQVNVLGQIHLLEACRALDLSVRVQIAGSSEEYGLVYPHEVPVRETNPLRPLSPYAVSKVAQDLLGYQYYMSYKTHIVRTRGFNHTGPRRGEVFAESNLAKQIAEIEAGLRPPVVYVGNLEAIRDYTDVRDMVRAYWLALEYGVPGEVYNISSGRGYKIRDVLEMLLRIASVDIDVQVDPRRLRPSDVEVLVGDSTRFREMTGWTPRIPFEQTLQDLLDYWRERVRAEKDGPPG